MKHWKTLRIASLILLVIMVWASIDLGMNLLAALVPSMNDGIGCRSLIFLLIHGDNGWSLEAYWQALNRCLYLTFLVLVENVVLAICDIRKH